MNARPLNSSQRAEVNDTKGPAMSTACQIPDDRQTKGQLYIHSKEVETGGGFQAMQAIGYIRPFRFQMLEEGVGIG